jgi:tRNA-dihydrouridine synthase B
VSVLTEKEGNQISLLQPLAIGNVQLEQGLILAPMAGVGNSAFRILCKEQGASLVCSEFVSAKALEMGNRRSYHMLSISDKERPVSVQIFGSEPSSMAYAARCVEECGADIVDINMGCPVPKVVKTHSGAALLKNPVKAAELVLRVVKAVSIPVTVKMRTGWDDTSINTDELAMRFQDQGVQAITVHGRTRAQQFSGEVDYETIARIRNKLSIPVIGNGGVTDPIKAEEMLIKTSCQGVMIGRGALGNPWIFKQCLHYFQTGVLLDNPGIKERIAMAIRHLELLAELKGDDVAAKEMRTHAPFYFKGFPGASRLRNQLVKCQRVADYIDLFQTLA